MQKIIVLSFLLILFCDTFGFQFVQENHRKKRQGLIFEDNTKSGCRTPSNEPGRCINIKNCKPLFDRLVNERNNPQVKDLLRRSFCGYERQDPKVCCESNYVDVTTQSSGENSPLREGPAQFPQRCGNASASVSRIVGGEKAKLRHWPWVAALGYRSRIARIPIEWNCGGAIITNRYVLTAAHCLNQRVIMVRLGDLDLNTTADGANHIDVQVERQLIHPEYNGRTHTSDIGLVRMRSTVNFTPDIQPICFPFSQQPLTKDFVGHHPYIAGWGSLSFQGDFPTHMYVAQVEVKSLESCQAAYAKLPRATVVLDERSICAGGGGKDSCQGDSGGPLMLPQQGLFYIFGVVSYGYKCAEPGYPGVYTRVSEFSDWVQENTV